jgi:hypothetical protein
MSVRFLEDLNVDGTLDMLDSSIIRLGSSNDLQIQHDGSHSYISQGGTGNLYIQQNTNDADMVFQCDDGSGGTSIYMMLDGSESRISTKVNNRFDDNVKLELGTSGDLDLLHDGSNSYIHHNGAGSLYMKADTGDINIINYTNDKDIILQSDDGSGGVTPYLTLDGSTAKSYFSTRLGVGITDPVSNLHVEEDSTATSTTAGLTIENRGTGDAIAQFLLTGATRWVVGADNSDSDKFKIASSADLNSNAHLTVDTSGNVGIGTTSPGQKLHVNGNIRVGTSTDAFYGNRFTALSNADVELRSNNGYDLILNANAGDNVGIGTTSPAKKLDVNGDTNITGYLDLTTSSPTGSPLLRFYQSTTRRGFIQMADTNNNLRVASEYGSVSLEAASSEGTDSDTSYIRIKPGGTVEIGAVDGDATISTDGSMTFKIDADNDETSQKFSFVNNAGTEVASIDESGNLTISGGIQASLPTSPGATGTLFNDRGTVRVS